jgi:LysR family transcriptional activator of mexEF-oprN operon
MLKSMINTIELRRADLNLLVVFAALFEERSVKRAAPVLFVGESAVSMALRRLRATFDDELFMKAAHGMEPTAKAVAIEPRISQALELVRVAMQDEIAFEPAATKRVVRIALSDDVGLWLLSALLDRCRAKAPGLQLVTHVCNWYSGLGYIERDEAGLAIGLFPVPGSSYYRQRLLAQRFVTVFDPAHAAPRLTRSRFLATPHALVSFRGDLTGPVDQALRREQVKRAVVTTVPTFALLGALLRGRSLFATVPESAARVLAAQHGLAMQTPPVTLAPYDIAMVWHARSSRGPVHAWLRKEIKTVADLEATDLKARSTRKNSFLTPLAGS